MIYILMSGNRQWSYQQDLETFVEEFEGNREAEGYTNKRRTRKWRWRARRSDAQSLGNWSRALPRSTALPEHSTDSNMPLGKSSAETRVSHILEPTIRVSKPFYGYPYQLLCVFYPKSLFLSATHGRHDACQRIAILCDSKRQQLTYHPCSRSLAWEWVSKTLNVQNQAWSTVEEASAVLLGFPRLISETEFTVQLKTFTSVFRKL